MFVKVRSDGSLVLLDPQSDKYMICNYGRVLEQGVGVGIFALGAKDRVVVSFLSSGNVLEMFVSGLDGVFITRDVTHREKELMASGWVSGSLVASIVTVSGTEADVRYTQSIYVMKGDKVLEDLGL